MTTSSPLPPGPPPRKGLIHSARYFYAFYTNPIGFVEDRFATYGDIYYAPSDGIGLYVIKHPEHLQQVLVTHASHYDKGHSALKRVSLVLGQGLLTADGEVWRRHRRMIQPAFRREALAQYAQVMVTQAHQQIAGWSSGQTLDIGAQMMALTLQVVSRTLFGRSAQDDIDDVRRAMMVFHDLVARPDILPSWAPSWGRYRGQQALASLENIIYAMIRERREMKASPAADLLQTLVDLVDEQGSGLTDREIRDQLLTLYIAGHETTSHALTWALYLLSQNPEVDAQVGEELDRVLGGRRPTVEDLGRLELLGRVMKEAMRLYPPAYVTGRRAIVDTQIGEYPVAAGSEVILWIYMAHHDPRWYEQPEKFLPDRFLPEAEAARPRMAYLPFGAGPRACIGTHFAMMEAQLVLATLRSRFRLTLASDASVAPKLRMTMYPAHGMPMVVHAV